jgi:hypothetical protein
MNSPLVHSLFELDQAENEMQFLQPSACKPEDIEATIQNLYYVSKHEIDNVHRSRWTNDCMVLNSKLKKDDAQNKTLTAYILHKF